MRALNRLLLAGLLAAAPLAAFAAADEAPNAEPEVTIRQEGDKTIQEYRVNGFLYAIKVVPKAGKPYFLVRSDGADHWMRSDKPDMLIPSWEIYSW